MKLPATGEDIAAFMESVFPDGGALATAAFDERYVLQTATKLIAALRSDVAALERQRADLATKVTELTGIVSTLHNANLKRIECMAEAEALRQWRVDVTSALQNPGGCKYEDVPNAIRGLRASFEHLADAVAGAYRHTPEDKGRMGTLGTCEVGQG